MLIESVVDIKRKIAVGIPSSNVRFRSAIAKWTDLRMNAVELFIPFNAA